MQVTVKLFGTLSRQMDDYNHKKGLMIELPKGAQVSELIKTLGLESARIGMVCINNQKVKPEDILPTDAEVSVYQPICGG
jgi:sulfur carrier protein ThiS